MNKQNFLQSDDQEVIEQLVASLEQAFFHSSVQEERFALPLSRIWPLL